MTVQAAIFDAFGTLVKISEGTHPYRAILKLGRDQGRRPKPSDAEHLLSMPMDLRKAAVFFGIHVDPDKMRRLEADLIEELANIQAYPDGLEVVEALQSAGVRVAVCSNLAKPYAAAIERLYPSLDGYFYSFAIGATKPSFEIYRHATTMLSIPPGDTWMIGDSKRCDCDAPNNYGFHGYFLDRTGSYGDQTLRPFAENVLHRQRITLR
ncbi:HAD family hydrolase [Pseudomonas sp. MDT1-16]